MDRNEAILKVKKHIQTENLVTHSLAVGAIMKELGEKLNKDSNIWEVTGILHDLDYEETKENPDIHAIKTVEILKDQITPEMKDAILAHNEKKELETDIEFALYASDQLSGLITAAVYVRPSKSINDLTVKSLKKKFKDKAFARGANREHIKQIEKLGLELNEFFEIGISGMKKISNELGL
ncbi:phosphohydrolase [Tepiditoga spiralis]|uniref:Phosphohydrolase n=1 Tax=Tepiditoga spiralis TaxID=2108365 RepID=A0A7G1G642_9BACT|nr:HD domain-containing protein [Tepiditoga spiralis]BBE30263.1 phosphohydrolase [Tepiditoga spiralis]